MLQVRIERARRRRVDSRARYRRLARGDPHGALSTGGEYIVGPPAVCFPALRHMVSRRDVHPGAVGSGRQRLARLDSVRAATIARRERPRHRSQVAPSREGGATFFVQANANTGSSIMGTGLWKVGELRCGASGVDAVGRVPASIYVNTRAENSHQAVRQRGRAMRFSRSPGVAQRFLLAFSGIAALSVWPALLTMSASVPT